MTTMPRCYLEHRHWVQGEDASPTLVVAIDELEKAVADCGLPPTSATRVLRELWNRARFRNGDQTAVDLFMKMLAERAMEDVSRPGPPLTASEMASLAVEALTGKAPSRTAARSMIADSFDDSGSVDDAAALRQGHVVYLLRGNAEHVADSFRRVQRGTTTEVTPEVATMMAIHREFTSLAEKEAFLSGVSSTSGSTEASCHDNIEEVIQEIQAALCDEPLMSDGPEEPPFEGLPP